MMIAPEGFDYIAFTILLAVAPGILAVLTRRRTWYILSAAGLLLLVAMLFFFRDPACPEPLKGMIVSPMDGRIVELEHRDDGSTRIAIFLSLFDVHAIRTPVSGTVIELEHVPGKFHRADRPESGLENEHVRIVIETEHGPVILRLIAGMVARRIVCGIDEGMKLRTGERIGFIRFGSRTEIIFPEGFDSKVEKGERVRGGRTLMGTFDHEAVDA